MEKTKIKIVVYALSLDSHIKKYAVRRRESLNHIKTQYDVDFKVFIDQPPSRAPESLALHGNNVEVIDIRENLTPKLEKLATPNPQCRIGYNAMCLFNFSEFFSYLKGYDYALRLDADCLLHSQVALDEFIDEGHIYGYLKEQNDSHPETKETLPRAINKYIEAQNINILCAKNDIGTTNFYNNFHISKLSFWTRPEVVDFINFIHSQNGIEKHRWGDSTLQANAVRMFCPSEKIFKFDFKYEHGSHEFKNF